MIAPIVVQVRASGGMYHAAIAQRITVASEAQVPGPGFSRPMPRKVATRFVQRGASEGKSTSGVVELVIRVVIFHWDIGCEIGDIFGRWNYIRSARPFAQIDSSATVATKREVRRVALYRLLAHRAKQARRPFLWHGLILDGRRDDKS